MDDVKTPSAADIYIVVWSAGYLPDVISLKAHESQVNINTEKFVLSLFLINWVAKQPTYWLYDARYFLKAWLYLAYT